MGVGAENPSGAGDLRLYPSGGPGARDLQNCAIHPNHPVANSARHLLAGLTGGIGIEPFRSIRGFSELLVRRGSSEFGPVGAEHGHQTPERILGTHTRAVARPRRFSRSTALAQASFYDSI
jgi:hypothetical protein